MRIRLLWLLAAVVLGFLAFQALPLRADESQSDKPWLIRLSIGAAFPSYSGNALGTAMRAAKTGNYFGLTLTGDHAIYWKLSKGSRWVLGPSYVAHSDLALAVSGLNMSAATAEQILISPSAMYFFGETVGSGFYVRMDAGFALSFLMAQAASSIAVSSFEVGPGFTGGLGYAFAPLGKGHVFLQASDTYATFQGGINTVSAVLGFMF